VRFHAKLIEANIESPAEYRYVAKRLFDAVDTDPHYKESRIDFYVAHGTMIKAYFRDRQRDSLVLNVSERNSVERVCAFLGREAPYCEFPHVSFPEIVLRDD
jgi:hypothetical protein